MNVKIYTTPTCPWCTKTKELLTKTKTQFQEIDVSDDQKASDEMEEKSGQLGVPVTDIDGEIIIGYDTEELKEALGI